MQFGENVYICCLNNQAHLHLGLLHLQKMIWVIVLLSNASWKAFTFGLSLWYCCQSSKNATKWPSVTILILPRHQRSHFWNCRGQLAMTFSAISCSFGQKECLRVFPQLLTNWPSSASTIVMRTQTQTRAHSVSSLTSLDVPTLSSLDCRDSVKSSPLFFTPPSILIFTPPTLSFCLSSLRQSSVAPLL